MEKINTAELLKDCPTGMELDCTMFDDVTFYGVSNEETIVAKRELVNQKLYLDSYGAPFVFPKEDSKCVIFPKGKTTWEGFVPPVEFKDGDVVATSNGEYVFILKEVIADGLGVCFLGVNLKKKKFFITNGDWYFNRHATEEEKQELFKAIKDNGYKWNAENKALDELIEPKFEVGNRIRYKRSNRVKLNIVSININEQFYHTSDKGRVYFKYQDDWDLVPNKFDITTLVPFKSRVLVREGKADVWQPAYYGFLNQRNKRFYTTTNTWSMCIPYNEDTKHLIGTTNDCDEYYKTWEQRT